MILFLGMSVMVSTLFAFLQLSTVCSFSVKNHASTNPAPVGKRALSGQKDMHPVAIVDADLETESDGVASSRRDFITSLVTGTAIAMTALSADEADAAERAEFSLPPETDTNAKSSALSSSDLDIASTSAVAVDWEGILQKASKKALGGGKAGASAAVVQVCSLMWLRTAMNYQYRYGGNLASSLKTLMSEGGVGRLYQGLPFALIQGPLTRFGDTAANVGILALLENIDATASLPLPLKTACGSATAGLWRICLMPVDSSKTCMQVEGKSGLERLWKRVGEEGPAPLYQGAFATAAATAVGHFPWFLTYNFLNDALPVVSASDDLLLSLARSALLGLCASCVSDTCSNSLRVLKTTKQTAGLGSNGESDAAKELSYKEVIELIIEKDGIQGLFGRGLKTRLLTNAIQGAFFSVLWRYFQQVGGVQ